MSKGDTQVSKVGGGYSSRVLCIAFLWSLVTYVTCSCALKGPQMDPGTVKILAPRKPFKSSPGHTCTPRKALARFRKRLLAVSMFSAEIRGRK